jgi:hypothetical protein
LTLHNGHTVDYLISISLPRVFPKVKRLIWLGKLRGGEHVKPPPAQEICALNLNYWDQLEEIHNDMGDTHNAHFPSTTYLLGSFTLSNLTTSSVTINSARHYDGDIHLENIKPTVKNMLGNLKNAPPYNRRCNN